MFNKKNLKEDKVLIRILSNFISFDYSVIGKFIDIDSVDSLIDRLVKADYERMKYLPISKLTIYKSLNIGIGYQNYISVRFLFSLIEQGLIDKDIKIELIYIHGNIYAYIKSTDLNIEVLKTDEVYLMVDELTNEIHSIKIGKYTNPNLLYYRKEFDGIVSTLQKVSTIPNFNSIHIK